MKWNGTKTMLEDNNNNNNNKIITINRQFIKRTYTARVTTKAPYNVRCSYSATQLVSEVRACVLSMFLNVDNVGAERMSSGRRLFQATGQIILLVYCYVMKRREERKRSDEWNGEQREGIGFFPLTLRSTDPGFGHAHTSKDWNLSATE